MKRIHFTGGGGRAIGSLALDLKQQGWQITASDDALYPPMSELLRTQGLEVHHGFSAASLPRGIDLLIRGSAVPTTHPELLEAYRRGVPVLDMPSFLEQHLLPKGNRIVVAGTNGKTTTTVMLAWILESTGLAPDYLFGGLCPHFQLPVRMRGADWKVLEGDEYPSNLENWKPKFLHYHPDILLITNLAYDHAEVYHDLAEISSHFRQLIAQVPDAGAIFIPDSSPVLRELAHDSRAKVLTVGRSPRANLRIKGVRFSRQGVSFRLADQRFTLRLPGWMNVVNAAMAVGAASTVGVSTADSASALAGFRGVNGRMEAVMKTQRGVLVLDEGYHPLAIQENLAALRRQYPGQRLTLALLPRFTGGKDGFQAQQLPETLTLADQVVLAGLYDPSPSANGPFSSRNLAAKLRRRGVETHTLSTPAKLPRFFAGRWRRGDVTLCSLPPGHEAITDAIRDGVNARDDL